MKIEPLVSVIIPAYNCEKFIEKCMISVIQQKYRNLQIIVIDDGSTDNTTAVLKSFEAQDSRILLMEQENCGVSAARNRGINHALGKYMTFVDGDDYLGTAYIEDMVNAAEMKAADFVFSGHKKVKPDGEILSEIIPQFYKRGEKEEWVYRLSAICGRLYRRDIWERYSIRFPEGVRGEDVPVTLYLNYICTNIVCLMQAEYYYVQHQESATHNFRGLKKYELPLKSMDEILEKSLLEVKTNSRLFFEFGILKVCTVFLFDLCIGADKEKLKKVIEHLERVIKKYCSGINDRTFWEAIKKMQLPIYQKCAMKIVVVLYNMRMLYPTIRIYSICKMRR